MNRTQLQEKYASGDRNFQGLDLSGADLSGLDLRHADFSGSDLYGAKLMDSLLAHANFSQNTNLAYADLRGADLTNANLTGANLDGACLEGANTQGIVCSNGTKFPVGFDPVIAGAIDIQEIERQSRIARTTALKQQPTPPSQPISQPSSPSTPPPSNAPPTLVKNTGINPSQTATNDDLSFPPTGFFNTSVTTTPKAETPTFQKPASNAWIGIFIGIFAVLGLGSILSNLFKPSSSPPPVLSRNPFESVQYPLPACGDPLPSNPNDFPVDLYPVFINNTSENFATVVRQFCQDAYETNRKDSGIRSIQVASFISRGKAIQFAEFMTQKVGSGDVGSPTRIYK